ncbi:hypothetical protein PAMP_016380 [Pampus punctatissimus]
MRARIQSKRLATSCCCWYHYMVLTYTHPTLRFNWDIMVPSLHWLLLLWGIQGLLAQDYEDNYEEEVVTTKKKNKVYSSNFTPQNGKCKSF